jgi:hypothetical protein
MPRVRDPRRAKMTDDSPADVASLRRQLAEKEENRHVIEERKSQGVDFSALFCFPSPAPTCITGKMR